MAQNYNSIANYILEYIGGKNNVVSYTNCQTRLRIDVNDLSKVSKSKLNKIEGALGISIIGNQIQIILGTGRAAKITLAFQKVSQIIKGKIIDATDDLKVIAKQIKAKQKDKNDSMIQKFLGKFAGIFAPLILGFIGAGILSGISSILKSAGADATDAGKSVIALFAVLLNIWKATFLVIIGWRTAEVFGGSGVYGAIIAGLYVAAFSNQIGAMFITSGSGYKFLGISINDPLHNWLTVGLRPGPKGLSYPSGSILGVMISSGVVGVLEKFVRKGVPEKLDMVLTPIIILLILLLLNILLIFPISGYLFTAIAFMFKNLYGNPFGAALLAGIFLTTVVFGVHQGFVPVYVTLLATTGVNGLFPVLAIGAQGQVGMALALWLRASKGGKLRKQIQGAIIPGILGIGEPLIYGVSLPRVKPFITAMLGGAVGGFFIGSFNLWGSEPIGLNTMFGPSGILATALMTTPTNQILTAIPIYLGGVFTSIIAGFGITYFLGFKNIDLA